MSKAILPLLALLGFASFAVAGCNTVEGAGRDISAAGRGVEHASEEAEEELQKEFND